MYNPYYSGYSPGDVPSSHPGLSGYYHQMYQMHQASQYHNTDDATGARGQHYSDSGRALYNAMPRLEPIPVKQEVQDYSDMSSSSPSLPSNASSPGCYQRQGDLQHHTMSNQSSPLMPQYWPCMKHPESEQSWNSSEVNPIPDAPGEVFGEQDFMLLRRIVAKEAKELFKRSLIEANGGQLDKRDNDNAKNSHNGKKASSLQDSDVEADEVPIRETKRKDAGIVGTIEAKESSSKNFRLCRDTPERSEGEVSFDPRDLALATVPGYKFDPSSRAFSLDELKPQPIIRKREKVLIPDTAKDDKYWTRRTKNNEAARRSREARRLKENQIALRAAFLEKENITLKRSIKGAVAETKSIRKTIAQDEERLQGFQKIKEELASQPPDQNSSWEAEN